MSAWDSAEKLLCVRLDSLGDVLMMTPAIRALKQAMPERHISLLSSSAGAAIAPFIDDVDDTIVYAAPWMKSSGPQASGADFAMIDTLRAQRFDGAVIFTTYSQSPLPAAMLCYLADIPLRLAHCRENPYRLLSDWVRETEPEASVRHEVRRQLDLVATINCRTLDEKLSWRVSDADREWARSYLEELAIAPGQTWIILHPGASAPSRCYPPQLWAQMAHDLAQRLDCPMVFTGSAEEHPLIMQIMEGVPHAYSSAGVLDLGKLAALISLAPLIIANNTGPAHIAAAVGTPIVNLYALTNPQHTPWQVMNRVLFHDVPCRFCYKSICPQGHHHCLTQVSPSAVADAALELLSLALESRLTPSSITLPAE